MSFLLRVENFRIEEEEEEEGGGGKESREKIYMDIKEKHNTQKERERE